MLGFQQLDGSPLVRRGVIDPSDGMIHPGPSIGRLLTLIPLLVNDESRYCGSRLIERRIGLTLDYAHAVQRGDGTFDLLPSNFFSSPDGAVFTGNSARQDKGEGAGGRFFPTSYYPVYLAMIERRFDPRYVYMVETINRQTVAEGGPGALYRFMLDERLKHRECDAETPSTNSLHCFAASHIARIRRGRLSVTILAGSSSFLFVQSGPFLSSRLRRHRSIVLT